MDIHISIKQSSGEKILMKKNNIIHEKICILPIPCYSNNMNNTFTTEICIRLYTVSFSIDASINLQRNLILITV